MAFADNNNLQHSWSTLLDDDMDKTTIQSIWRSIEHNKWWEYNLVVARQQHPSKDEIESINDIIWEHMPAAYQEMFTVYLVDNKCPRSIMPLRTVAILSQRWNGASTIATAAFSSYLHLFGVWAIRLLQVEGGQFPTKFMLNIWSIFISMILPFSPNYGISTKHMQPASFSFPCTPFPTLLHLTSSYLGYPIASLQSYLPLPISKTRQA